MTALEQARAPVSALLLHRSTSCISKVSVMSQGTVHFLPGGGLVVLRGGHPPKNGYQRGGACKNIR